MTPLTERFASAVQWNLALSAVTVAAQLAVTAVVARLLTPDDFGLFAMASVALVVATHLGGPSLISAIVREPALDDAVVGSATLLACLLSVALAAVTMLLAPLAGFGSGVGQAGTVTGLVRLMSVSILAAGIGAPAQAMMQRELHFRELGLTQLAALVFGSGATTVVLARLGIGPWSLVGGNIAYSVIVAGGCWWQMRARWSLRWQREQFLRVGRMGLRMTLLRVLDALWMQMPLIAAHLRLAPFAVGLYQRSQSLVDMGVQSTCARVNNVLFPVMASRQDRDRRLRELIPLLTGIYALFLLPAAAFVVAASPLIVTVLLGRQWQAAAVPLALLMIAFAALFVSQPASSQWEARAVFGPRTLAAGWGVLSVGLGGFLLAPGWGVVGIGAAAIISGVGTSAINFAGISVDLGIGWREIIAWLAAAARVAIAVAGATLFSIRLLANLFSWPPLQLLAVLLAAGLAFVAAARLLLGGARRRLLADLISSAAPRPILHLTAIFGLGGRGRIPSEAR